MGPILPAGFALGEEIYQNPLAAATDIDGFRLEGEAAITFPHGRLRLENALPPELGQKANYVFWCPEEFPADIAVTWKFYPLREPGLAMFWLAARGRAGEDLFDPSLAPRAGEYHQYNKGDINAYHISYFRRNLHGVNDLAERSFQTCNFRKSYGHHLVAEGPDLLPPASQADPPYELWVVKAGPEVSLHIGHPKRPEEPPLCCVRFRDDGETYGPVLGGGKIGFRQMSPLMAEYADLTVFALSAAGA
jgi:hypothetical protein